MSDRDQDGMPDEAEAQNGTNPDDPADADGDADGDGLTNGDEVAGGTNVNNTDSDGDGVSDAEEVRLGFNPLDPNSTPPPNTAIVSISIAPSSLTISINTIFGQQPAQLMVIGVTNTNTTVNLTASPNTTYQSLNPAVALVDDFGQVAGVADGLTTVEARYQNLTAQTSVNVATLTPGGLSSIAIPGYANNVDVAGNYAYVAAGAAGLQVVNVSDRSNPQIVGALDTPGNANDVRIVGNLAYVADGGAGLRIIDVSDPLNPIMRGVADTPGEAQDVFVVANRAYIADGPAGLQIIDVSNPAAPTILGAADTPGIARGVAVVGNTAVVADDANGGGGGGNTAPIRQAGRAALNSSSAANAVQVIDVANPAAPHIVGCANVPGSAKDLAARNSLAYVASFTGGMYVVDFSNPAAPFVAGSLPFGGPGGFIPRDLELAGDFVFAAEQLFVNAVPVVDVRTAANPQYRGVIDFSPLGDYNGTGLALDSQFAYMTGDSFIGPDNGVNGDTRLFIGRYQTLPNDTGNVAPTVTLTAPQAGQPAFLGQSLTISANAVDDVYVAGAQFTVNGAIVGAVSSPPYSFSYPVPLNATSLTVGARAFDLAGNVGEAAPVTVSAVDPPPVINITAPAAGEDLFSGNTIELAADITDNGSVALVEFLAAGQSLGTLTAPPYAKPYLVPDGVNSVTFQIRATDNLGNVGVATRTAQVFPDPLPSVFLDAPFDGQQFIAGQTFFLAATAFDNGNITQVEFLADGQSVGTDTTAPYTQNYAVPLNAAAVTITARATDNLGQSVTASRTVTVISDPKTTVTGRVVEGLGSSGGGGSQSPQTLNQAAPGLTVTVFNQFTATTGNDGAFTIPDVPTINGDIIVQVSGALNGRAVSASSQPFTPQPGGVTNVGDIDIPLVNTTILPAVPTVFGLGKFNSDNASDLFLGFPNQPLTVYHSDGAGLFTAGNVLPLSNTTAAASLWLSDSVETGRYVGNGAVFAQVASQPGLVNRLSFNSGGNLQTSATFANGLATDNADLAAGKDSFFPSLPVLAILQTNGGASLQALVGNGGGGFNAPVALPVEAGAQLRTPLVADVTNDGLADILVIQQLPGNEGRLIVYPRADDTTFGPPVASTVTLRSVAATANTRDYAVGRFDGFTPCVSVLGDDRARMYCGDNAGNLTFDSDIPFPAGSVPLGLAAPTLTNFSSISSLLVSVAATSDPANRSLLLYTFEQQNSIASNALNAGGPPPAPRVFTYTGPATLNDTKVFIGYWNDPTFIFRADLGVLDGNLVVTVMDVGPVWFVD